MKKLLFISFLLFACTQPVEEQNYGDKPDEKKMLALLVELHLTEAITATEISLSDTTTLKTIREYNKVFHRHHTSKEEFRKNLDWYTEHLDDFEKIMEKVVDSLGAMSSGVK